MPKRLLHLARKMRHHEPFWIEALSGLAGLLWGIYSSLSPAHLEDSPIYAPVAAHASGAGLETLSVLLGMAQLYALYRDKPEWRAGASCLLCMWWAIPARLILNSETGAPAVVVYAVFGVLGNCITVWCFAPQLLAALHRCFPCRVAPGLFAAAHAHLRRLRRTR